MVKRRSMGAEQPDARPAATRAPSRPLVTQTRKLAEESARLWVEWAGTLIGSSEREVPAKDPRFADPAWRDHPLYRRLGQGYLAFCEAADRLSEHNPDWHKRQRAKFLTGIVTSSLAPSNLLLTNPAAVKRAFETGGMSLVSGVKNMLGDWLHNKGMPSQVKAGTFKVGENLAATPGAVVFRNEMVELLQYQPMTAEVSATPTLLIVPPVGKYYFLDLAPRRSFIEHAVSRGIPMFTISWRNPQREHAQWGVDDYVQSLLDVVDAVCDITGSDKINTLGMCAGGILSTLMLAVMAERGDKRVQAASFCVMLLDLDTESPLGSFKLKPVLSMSRRQSSSKGILPASSLANVFAWMRPNELVWNYWANNYLMGKEPPAFDILAWSVDNTNLPGKLHGQFVDIFEGNLLTRPGGLTVLGVPIDLKRVRIETFCTGAISDHITPWKGCYRTTQLLGGPSQFVLSNAGHIASLVNPPGNPKATYWMGPKPGPSPDDWLAHATQKVGTWWELWADWTLKRSGPLQPASTGPGSARYPATDAAPGLYVHQKS